MPGAPLPEPLYATVGSLLRIAGKGPEHFAQELGGWTLVGDPGEMALPAAWAYRTDGVKTVRGVRGTGGEVEAVLDESWAAFVLKKRVGTAFPDTIFVGRATNNDTRIPHPTVSKLHARVKLLDDGIVVQDAGSANGTMINGTLVATGVNVTCTHGDLVRFGSMVFQLFEPKKLWFALERFGATR